MRKQRSVRCAERQSRKQNGGNLIRVNGEGYSKIESTMKKRNNDFSARRDTPTGLKMDESDKVKEIEQQTDAPAREYAATHDPKIIVQLNELSRRFRELEGSDAAI